MNENYRIDPNGVDAILHMKSENEILTYVQSELLRKYGTAPSLAELRTFFIGESADSLPNFTFEQEMFVFEKMMEYPLLQRRRLNHMLVERMCEEACADDED